MRSFRGVVLSVLFLVQGATQLLAHDSPAWRSQKVDLGIQTHGRPWVFELKDWIQNPQGVSFEASNLPRWMDFDANTGRLSGTPGDQDVGPYDGIVFTALSEHGRSAANGSGLVLDRARAPRWKDETIALGAAREGFAYSASLSDHIDNPDKLPLEFELVSSSAPRWVSVGKTTGAVFGTPEPGSRGETSLRVTMRSKPGGTPIASAATVKITVVATNRAPEWKADPLVLPGALSGHAYEQDLSRSVKDPDGDGLTFALVSGPQWASLDEKTGVFSGVPEHADAGLAQWVVSATDEAGLTTRAEVRLRVAKTNEPPVWEMDTITLPNAQQGRPYQADLGRYVRDPDGDTLRFIGMQIPAWVTVGSAGALLGTPGREDVGPVKAQVRVEDGKGGHATATLSFFVEPVNESPFWILDPIQVKAPEGQPLTLDLAAYARDGDGDKLRFGTVQTAGWGELSPDGLFTGTPGPQHVGRSVFQFRATDPEGAGATTRVWVQVLRVNKAPVWTSVPALPAAVEGRAYQASLAQYVSDKDPGELVFEKVGPAPSWIKVASNGLVTGTPWRRDVGSPPVTVRVSDAEGAFSETTFNIQVNATNQPPRWRQSPLYLGDAVDDDGDTLRFEKVQGPAWLLVDANGRVFGRPAAEDVGPFEAVLRVRDGAAFADVQARGTVLRVNTPPTQVAEWPVFQVKERETLQTTLNDPKYIKDPDGDALNFAMKQLVPWVEVTPEGQLTLTPSRTHRGKHGFALAVDDGKKALTVALQVEVLPNPRPPYWHLNPIERLALTNMPFTGSLKDHAQDRDDLPLSFFKKSGKDWLTVASDGSFKGTPGEADRGKNVFEVSVCNADKLCADAELVVDVGNGLASDRVRLSDAVEGASTEILWVLDPSSASDSTVKAIRGATGEFDRYLTRSGVTAKHTTLWSNAGEGVPSGIQSPLWTLYGHLIRPPSSKTPSPNLTSRVPLEAVIVTRYRDALAWFTDRRSEHRGTPASQYWKATHDALNKAAKPFRVSAVVPECSSILTASGESKRSLPEDTYSAWVKETGGFYFNDGCSLHPDAWLGELGTQIALWARVTARHQIRLSRTPVDPDRLEITLAGHKLESVDESPAWKYDTATASVRIEWNRVRKPSKLSGTDYLEIKYSAREAAH